MISSFRYLFAAPGRDAKGRRVIIARPGIIFVFFYYKTLECYIDLIKY